MSEWTEISEEDFAFLKKHIHYKNKDRYNHDQFVIVEPLDDKQTDGFINDLKAMIDKERIEVQIRKKAEEDKKAEKLRKKLARDAESKRQLFERLKTELGE